MQCVDGGAGGAGGMVDGTYHKNNLTVEMIISLSSTSTSIEKFNDCQINFITLFTLLLGHHNSLPYLS